MRLKVKIKEIDNRLVFFLQDTQEFGITLKHNGVHIGLSSTPKANYTYITLDNILISIADNDEIIIGKQFTAWKFKRISKDRWIAAHNSFKTKVIRTDKEYLLAVSSGSARNGILHNIQKQQKENKLGA